MSIECHEPSCDKPARMAVRVTRPKRDNIMVASWADERTAPATATPYCKQHGLETVRVLLDTVVNLDEGET